MLMAYDVENYMDYENGSARLARWCWVERSWVFHGCCFKMIAVCKALSGPISAGLVGFLRALASHPSPGLIYGAAMPVFRIYFYYLCKPKNP
jgi:hypothetical protein